jgi:oligopeptide transport system substrate-binding protein
MWRRELGVEATIAQLEQKTSIQNQRTLDYVVGSNGWVADFADPVTFMDLFVTNGGGNWTGWSDAAYDRAIATAGGLADSKQRFALFQQAEATLLEQAPIAPLIFGARNYLIHPAVKGWEPSPTGMYQYKKVYLEP